MRRKSWFELPTLAIAAASFVSVGSPLRGVAGSPHHAPAARVRQAANAPDFATSRRARVSLDGAWRFQPASGGAPANGAAWGTLSVPGTWTGAAPGLIDHVAAGSGPLWRDFDGANISRAWYERTVSVPADWTGRAILLTFDRISTDALIVVDGKNLGSVRWPCGSVDITQAVQPGGSAVIRVLVVAASSSDDASGVLSEGGRRAPAAAGALMTRGIIGSAWLESRPQTVYVSDVFVQTSTRKKQLDLAVEVTGHLAVGSADITARVLDETGREEKQFSGQAVCAAADRQVLAFSLPWSNPRLWDLGKPSLYTLVLAVKAPGLDDEVRATFGFREFWIEGKRFYLNGIPIRLRPTGNQDIDAARRSGFNFTELSPEDFDHRGTPGPDPAWFDRADQAGWLTAGRLASMAPYVVDKGQAIIWNGARREAWAQRVEGEMRPLRNHPSLLMWGHSPGFFGNPQDQNPRVIGRIDRAKRASPPAVFQAGLEGCAIVRRLDPTRPVYTPEGADIGDVFTVRHFLNFIPLQEREDWMTEWAKSGDMPYMGIKFGTPLFTTFLRGRMDFDHAVTSEPLVTEFAAAYLGRKAYMDETTEYRASYINRFEKGQTYRFDGGGDRARIIGLPALQEVEALFNRATWRSWRTAGVTGGMLDRERQGWNGTDLNESGRALVENNGPTLAWITGPWDAPTAKTHAYHVDEIVEKQVALINDTRQVQSYRYYWRALINGKPLTSGAGQGRIYPAQTLFRPLRFATPFFRSGKADGLIVLTARIGDQSHDDRFAYRVFSRRLRRDRPPSLPVFDPTGKTGDVLPVVDYIPRAWKGERTVPLVVIGQNALSSPRRMPGSLEAYVRGGGRVLIFSQNPAWIEKTLGMRTAAYPSRRVFPVSETHPLMRALDALDLRDWRGSSSLLPAKPFYTGDTPPTGWHWGNRGSVSSVPIEKPHMSSWRPLLENEFDLAYTPLMELDYGEGRVLWSTLDLEDHAVTDAAAERVFDRLLDYALHAPLTPKAERVVYIGNRAGADLLTGLGVIFRDADTEKVSAALLSGQDAPQLLIAGEGAAFPPGALARYVHRGGRVFYLRRDQSGAEAAPALAVQTRHGSLEVPNWAECRGLSVSDMHWRADLDTPILQTLPDLAMNGVHGVASIGADGLLGRIKLGRGTVLYCQVAPDRLDAGAKTYLRYTRWRQTHTLCQLLSNMGASFRQDARIFHPNDDNTAAPGFYYPDYRTDFELGDDPYRYYRW